MKRSMKKLFMCGIMAGIASLSLIACAASKAESDTSANRSTASESATAAANATDTAMQYVVFDEIKPGSQLIDTRHTEYYLGWKNENGVSGHIPSAIDFPAVWLDYESNKEYLDIELIRRDIDKAKTTVLYADEDVEQAVFDKFRTQGFSDLYVLKGGINAYVEDDKPTERLEGYQRYVSPRWVEELISGKNPEGYTGQKYRIVEISLASESDEFAKAGHIKGAVNINAE